MNETNSVISLPQQEQVQKGIDWLKGLPPEMFILVVLIGLGYAMRRWSWFPNRVIVPLCTCLSSAAYIFLGSDDAAHPMAWNLVHKIGIGAAIGVASAIAAVGLHNVVLPKLVEKWPWLKFIICDDGQTAFFIKGAKPANATPPPAATASTALQPPPDL